MVAIRAPARRPVAERDEFIATLEGWKYDGERQAVCKSYRFDDFAAAGARDRWDPHHCVANMPGAVAYTSAFALYNATLPFARRLAQLGARAAMAEAFGLPFTKAG